MSKNQAKKIQPYTAYSDLAHKKYSGKGNNNGFIVGLVPQRKKFSDEKEFQQLMEEYIFQLRRLEVVKELWDCLKKSGG